MNLKLKRILSVILCIVFSMALLCGCKNDKTNNSTSENTSGENKYNKEEYVKRITAYKEYYEGIENDYESINGAVLVRENGMPYMVLCYIINREVDNYKIQLIDYKDGKTVLNGEKEFYGGERNYDISLAFVDDRCIMEVEVDAGESEYPTEYWEFKNGNLLAQQIKENDVEKLKNELDLTYVYAISEEKYEYLYTSKNQRSYNPVTDHRTTYRTIFIHDEKSNINTVNKIAAEKLYDFMELTDEQKEYFVYPKFNDNGEEILLHNIANICDIDGVFCDITHYDALQGVSFKQLMNELINEPIYTIEEIYIKQLDFMICNDGHGKSIYERVEEAKEQLLQDIYEQMPKYNPYNTDEKLLGKYYGGIREICLSKGESINAGGYTIDENTLPNYSTDLATLMGMYNVTQALDVMFEESPLKYDYIFTSDEFKGATWKDITFNGSHKYPVLTLSKNGNVMSYSVFDNYVEFRENTELKRAIEAYAAITSDACECAFVYIDEDDIPEMIVSYYDYQYGGFTNIFYSYTDGELIISSFNSDMRFDGYVPKQNNIAIFEEDYFYEEDGTSYRDGKYEQYSIIDNEFKYVKDIELTEEYESVSFEEDIISALGKIFSLTNGI